MDMHFKDLFQEVDGEIIPRHFVKFGKTVAKPNVSIKNDDALQELNLSLYRNNSFEVELRNNVYQIEGIYY